MEKYEVQPIEISQEKIPSIITSQFREITNLQTSIKNAMDKAERAKESADSAKKKSAGLLQKKEAIESLQSAQVDLAESQISATEAQQVSFEYQKKLGQITQYLFGLGVTNLAANRSVVRELEMKLKGASEEELNDLARQEILNVVKQLKAQEDIMNKQAELSERVKRHEGLLKERKISDIELQKKVEQQLTKYKEHDRMIADQAEKYKEHDRLLVERAEKDKEHDRLLAEQAEKDKEHDRLLAEQLKRNKVYDDTISDHVERLDEQEKQINVTKENLEELVKQVAILHKDFNSEFEEHSKKEDGLQKAINDQLQEVNKIKKEIEDIRDYLELKSSKRMTYASMAIAVVSFGLAILQFFI